MNYLFNKFIDELIKRNAWKGINDKPKTFTFQAIKSNICFSGEIQKDLNTGKKQFCVATFLPPNDPNHNPYDFIIKLNI